jgi:CHAT domain-containing protein/tetratricopeptide (TPR) repeat protein
MNDSPLSTPLSSRQEFAVPGGGAIQVASAPDWIGDPEPGSGSNTPLTLSFRENPQGAERLIVTVRVLDGDPPSLVEIWSALHEAFNALRDHAEESRPVPCGITTTNGYGCFFTVTDRSPAPGEFRFMSSGMVLCGGLLLQFTILTNPHELMLFSRALATIRSAVHRPPGSDPKTSNPSALSSDELIGRFLNSDLNSEAALLVQDHPGLLKDDVLNDLRRLADSLPSGEKRNLALGAVDSLGRAQIMGASAILAPAEFLETFDVLAQVMRGMHSDQSPGPSLIDAFERALELQGGIGTPSLHLMAADYYLRVMQNRGGVEQSIGHLTSARRLLRKETDRFIRASISTFLSGLYLNRTTGTTEENMENALDCARSAVSDLDGAGFIENWVTAKKRMGLAFARRVRGFEIDNVENSIGCFERALAFCPADSRELWGLHNNLALILLRRVSGDPYDNARASIAHLNQALQYSGEAQRAGIKTNLGNAWLKLGEVDIESREEAIAAYQQAADLYKEGDPWNWAGVQHNLGNAFLKRELGTRPENEATALRCLSDALTIRTLSYPSEHRSTQMLLGSVYLSSRRWKEAESSFAAAIMADERIADTADSLDAISSEILKAGTTYADAAYCQLQLGSFEEAFLTMEKGTARVLGRAFETDLGADRNELSPAQRLEVDLAFLDLLPILSASSPDDPQWVRTAEKIREELPERISKAREVRAACETIDPKLKLEQYLAAIRTGGALVEFVVTKAGSAAFVLPAGTKKIAKDNIVWIDNFTENDLAGILTGNRGEPPPSGWLAAQAAGNRSKRKWRSVIRTTGKQLWEKLFLTVYERLTALALEPQSPVTLLPGSALSILPLHACWREVNGIPRYLAEDFTISYCPSALTLSSLQRKLLDLKTADRSKSLLAVANPTGDLPFATLEGRLIAGLYAPELTRLLSEEQASWSEVGRAYRECEYVHFACHGQYDPVYPMRSFLVLARPRELPGASGFLRLHELMVSWNNTARLIVLSGCETGITDAARAPSEFTGLSSGWLRTGAVAVISTLWLIDDFCTMLLMERFYQLLFARSESTGSMVKSSPDAALRAAQLWLRDLSSDDVSAHLVALSELPGISPDIRSEIVLRKPEFDAQPSRSKPFSEPYWWAGFLCSGV